MRIVFVLLISFFALYAKIECITTIEPIEFLVEKVGGDKVNAITLVSKGASAHTYEPKPAQMKALANADFYFAIGTEFEGIWVPRFKSNNRDLTIVRVDKNIKKLPSIKHSHGDDDHHHHHAKEDAHIWLSPKNMIIIAKDIAESLASVDPQNSDFYMANFKQLESDLTDLDNKTAKKLSDLKGKSFLVFHPAWQYFANAYGLNQIAIEVQGKEPKPKELAHTIEHAKEHGIKAIFVHSNQSNKSATVVAKEIGGRVIVVDPLSYDYFEMITKLSDELQGAFN